MKGSYTFEQLQEEFNRVQLDKAKMLEEKSALLRPVSELRKKRDSYVTDHLNGLTAEQLQGLLKKWRMPRSKSGRSIIPMPALSIVASPATQAFESRWSSPPKIWAGNRSCQPSRPELLTLHDPEKFGCSPCHGGNGMALESVERAHGNYEHWLWPLHPVENVQAGCQQCHAMDMVLDHAPVLSYGKDLFQYRGCVGCHRFQNYDREPEEIVAVQQQVMLLETQRHDTQRDIQHDIQMGDQAPDNDTARMYYTLADKQRVSISDIDCRLEQLDRRSKDLLRDLKKVGPDLKEVRVKIHPDWIPVWISNPHAWRPGTRMPRFRLADDEVKAIAAFIWQSGIDGTLPQQQPGDPVKGKESFETRGCMGCHSLDESNPGFAANLSRVGEKDNYDYLVRWIHNPRERTRPYCAFEKRDLTEDDYKRHGLPFVFDLDHTKCPNDGHELQVEQETIMPNLRLTLEEARDIASYLMTLKKQEPASYAHADYLSDPNLKAQGHALVQRYGCAGCHEIAGMEDEGRIGTELTKEGSKPIEQIDFALLTAKARQQGWYDHKGFFEHKLEKPEVYDTGRDWKDRDPNERLRMPDLDMKPQEISALTTFLMGAVESQIPPRYWDTPEDQKHDIQEGWWVVKKYNCMGCHQFMVGQSSHLMTLARYQTPEWKDQLPPKLMGEGARESRLDAEIPANPAMDTKDTDCNGVRPYLKVRMPTFYFSPIEVRKLVRFFQALASQPMPYIPPKLDPLSEQEIAMARALFTSKAAPCLKCHATGDPAHDKFATAPNFLLARDRLKPGWARRWMLDPSMISPGTAMPSGLFKPVADHYVFAGPTPDLFKGYDGDQPELLVRYLFEITPEEQRRLMGMSSGKMSTTEVRGQKPGVRSQNEKPVGPLAVVSQFDVAAALRRHMAR